MKSKRGMGSATRGGGCVVKRGGGTPPKGERAAEGVTPDMLKWMGGVTGPMLEKPMLKKSKPKTMKTKSGRRLPLEPMIKR